MNVHTKPILALQLSSLPGGGITLRPGSGFMEFHVSASVRTRIGFKSTLFKSSGNLVLPDFAAARDFAARLRNLGSIDGADMRSASAGRINALGLIDEILHAVFAQFRKECAPRALEEAALALGRMPGGEAYRHLLLEFTRRFPPRDVFAGLSTAEDWLESLSKPADSGPSSTPNYLIALEELILLKVANENPAFTPFRPLFDDGSRPGGAIPGSLADSAAYEAAFAALEHVSKALPSFGPPGFETDFLSLLRMPAREAPQSLEAQIKWMKAHWGATFHIPEERLLLGLDLIAEEEMPRFPPGPGPSLPYSYRSIRHEYEKFTADRDWMPSLVLIAKNALVWLHQLSVSYGATLSRLDQIPDRELDILAARGINGLWLIGIWERSPASETIKRRCGNPEAAASAYSLFDYDIAPELGGWEALDKLRERCMWRGIKLAADMVPNHTGIDSRWVRERPDLFVSTDHCPFPSYTFNGPDLSGDPSVGIWLEDHYYSRSDAAVVFKRMDRRNGKITYLYHGNDGTGMAWNDTAQIDFLNPQAREAVKERILHVARHFSIIRFDAAMVLARQHVRRLWYPAPGSGGAIPSRAEHAMGDEAFDQAMPTEFWRDVVDLCAREAPDTLLLAEAFWMMEGYFVRTLGMHRVYNSAFMNMLKDEKNSLYRLTVKNTQEFDPQILKRFVNFMSNPDEETAVAQFGSGDKYFGVCTLLATMPGLPMFGHGQVEGLTEKYGMEYRRSYRDEAPDLALVERHEREIFPLLRLRPLFAHVGHFNLFDFVVDHGMVDENVFAYSNGSDDRKLMVFFNNHWQRTRGRIFSSTPFMDKAARDGKRLRTRPLLEALGIDHDQDQFLVAREFKTGLWRLYSCQTLAREGLELTLEGYEAKVFLDISGVRDEDGRYARLAREIGNSSVPDLDEALEEAARPELFHALSESLAAISGYAKGDSPSSVIREKAEAYYSRLALEIEAEGGSHPGLEAVTRACAVLDKGLKAIEGSAPQDRLHLAAFIFMDALAQLDVGANKSEELRYLLEKFHVAKKLAGGLGEDATGLAYAFATRPRIAAPAPGSSYLEPDPRRRAIELLRWAQEDRLARQALGVNPWEGKEYFIAENFESLLKLWPRFAWLEAVDSGISRKAAAETEKAAQAVAETARAALGSCGYQLQRLISILEAAENI